MLAVTSRARHDLLTLPMIADVPLLHEPDEELLAAYVLAADHAARPTDGSEWPEPKYDASGRPKMNAYIAAEVAYMHDVECRAEFTSPERYGWFDRDAPLLVPYDRPTCGCGTSPRRACAA